MYRSTLLTLLLLAPVVGAQEHRFGTRSNRHGSPWQPDRLLELDLPQLAEPVPFDLLLDIGRLQLPIHLQPVSLRAPAFQVLVDSGDGRLLAVDPGPPRTFEGEVMDSPGSRVNGSLDELGGLTALIKTDLGTWVVEPLERFVPGTGRRAHLVYSTANRPSPRGTCGVDSGTSVHGPVPPAPPVAPAPGTGPLGTGRAAVLAYKSPLIAFDVDYELFLAVGSSVSGAVAYAESVLLGVQGEYDTDFALKFKNLGVVVRASPADPYTTSNANALLGEFGALWNATIPIAGYDLAHLLTGRNLDGSTIGIAWTGGTCSSFRYGLAETLHDNDYIERIWVSAHEIGHNLNANHHGDCGVFGDPCQFMCAGLSDQCADLGTGISWHSQSVGEIAAFVNGLACLATDPNLVYVDVANTFLFPDGTQYNPFPTVGQGVAESASGAMLSIAAGTYPEGVLTINVHRTLTATGGPVVIQ